MVVALPDQAAPVPRRSAAHRPPVAGHCGSGGDHLAAVAQLVHLFAADAERRRAAADHAGLHVQLGLPCHLRLLQPLPPRADAVLHAGAAPHIPALPAHARHADVPLRRAARLQLHDRHRAALQHRPGYVRPHRHRVLPYHRRQDDPPAGDWLRADHVPAHNDGHPHAAHDAGHPQPAGAAAHATPPHAGDRQRRVDGRRAARTGPGGEEAAGSGARELQDAGEGWSRARDSHPREALPRRQQRRRQRARGRLPAQPPAGADSLGGGCGDGVPQRAGRPRADPRLLRGEAAAAGPPARGQPSAAAGQHPARAARQQPGCQACRQLGPGGQQWAVGTGAGTVKAAHEHPAQMEWGTAAEPSRQQRRVPGCAVHQPRGVAQHEPVVPGGAVRRGGGRLGGDGRPAGQEAAS
mmetsp:Transcript_23763/g.61734  ORF Transcript_23763/g.61734 Transcript_23763/m.61734 type:complete len:409 (+) Transcript_23763:1481-2707(+)